MLLHDICLCYARFSLAQMRYSAVASAGRAEEECKSSRRRAACYDARYADAHTRVADAMMRYFAPCRFYYGALRCHFAADYADYATPYAMPLITAMLLSIFAASLPTLYYITRARCCRRH